MQPYTCVCIHTLSLYYTTFVKFTRNAARRYRLLYTRVCEYVALCVHFIANGHLSGFMNSTAMNILLLYLWGPYVYVSVGCTPSHRSAGSQVCIHPASVNTANRFPKWLYGFTVCEGLLHILANTWHFLSFSYLAIMVNAQWYCIMVLTIIYPMTNETEHISLCLLALQTSSFVKCLLYNVPVFLLGCLLFLLIWI